MLANEASVGWATRCPRGSHSWDFAQLFLFSADIHNISIPPTPPQYFRQPESFFRLPVFIWQKIMFALQSALLFYFHIFRQPEPCFSKTIPPTFSVISIRNNAKPLNPIRKLPR
ncbi:hypothetical protein [Alysiella crassa]|nr:hypothetical protein [Alysiella crassa]UOP06645.1 hypothetical protein LVJ80_13050 [Alysiella crassa]